MLFLALILAMPPSDPAGQIVRACRDHQFDPAILAPFLPSRLDPLIVELEWNGVRKEVEAALRPLKRGRREIALPITFIRLNGGWLLPVFVFEKGNDEAKRVFERALTLRSDAVWDYEPALGMREVEEPVRQTGIAFTKSFKPSFREGGSLNLVQIYKGLQDLIWTHPEIKPLGFQPLELDRDRNWALRFTTTWKSAWKSENYAIAWRFKVFLTRHDHDPDVWEFIPKIELGKRFASQARYNVISDSMRSDFAVLTGHIHVHADLGIASDHKANTVIVMKPVAIPGEPYRPEVPPPIQRLSSHDLSDLNGLARSWDVSVKERLQALRSCGQTHR